MLAALGFSLLLQQTPPAPSQRKQDSVTAAIGKKAPGRAADHVAAAQSARARAKARTEEAIRSLTPEMLASSFKDPQARELLLRARQSRFIQDSALVSYDANSYQRISAWMGFGAMPRARLIFRTEHSGHVRWQRDVGVWMDVTGARMALPGIPDEGEREARGELRSESGDMVPVPYFPGSDPLWVGREV